MQRQNGKGWRNFWWHPVTGPVLPMIAVLGAGFLGLYVLGLLPP
jgi:hypothetical protein